MADAVQLTHLCVVLKLTQIVVFSHHPTGDTLPEVQPTMSVDYPTAPPLCPWSPSWETLDHSMIDALTDGFNSVFKIQTKQRIPPSRIISLLLPFLRQCAILLCILNQGSRDSEPNALHKYVDFITAPSRTVIEQFDSLCSVLNVPSATEFLRQVVAPSQWGMKGGGVLSRMAAVVRTVLVDLPRPIIWINRPWTHLPFHLLLPHSDYHRVHRAIVGLPCGRCGSVPAEPGFCLVCGAVLCAGSPCCKLGSWPEISQHVLICGNGVGMVLLPRLGAVLCYAFGRGISWHALFLDRFGEEDVSLQRGCPLALDVDRYQQLLGTFRNHRFDSDPRFLQSTMTPDRNVL